MANRKTQVIVEPVSVGEGVRHSQLPLEFVLEKGELIQTQAVGEFVLEKGELIMSQLLIELVYLRATGRRFWVQVIG